MKTKTELLIFDMDGVLVDVRDSYHRAVVETVRHFTGLSVNPNEIHRWKNNWGYNDDWKLTCDWIRSLGARISFAQVKETFQTLYAGKQYTGFIQQERWLLNRSVLRRLARRVKLALCTGRPREEALWTLRRFCVRGHFQQIVALDDVKRPKPDQEGLVRLLEGRRPQSALYLGDSIDDALAARRAGVPFIGILPWGSPAWRLRAPRLRQLGARAVLNDVNEVEGCLR